MKRDHLFRLFREAHRITGHRDYVVVGSRSILGVQDEEGLPAEMSMSNDIDAYTKANPGRIHDLGTALGEGSEFHRQNGHYLDPVSTSLPAFPDGWQHRMTSISRDDVTLWFIDPDDAAMSKHARSAPNDLRRIRAGILSGLVWLPKIRQRPGSTTFLDGCERRSGSAAIRRRGRGAGAGHPARCRWRTGTAGPPWHADAFSLPGRCRYR